MNKIMKASLKVRVTNFYRSYNENYVALIDALVNDCMRNNFIIKDVLKEIKTSFGTALVILDRRDHCNVLAELLKDKKIAVRVLTSETDISKRNKIVRELNRGKVDVLVATSKLIGEGFDVKYLSSIFLTTPIAYHGRLKQYIGRILRITDGKDRATVYDYLDELEVLKASFIKEKMFTVS